MGPLIGVGAQKNTEIKLKLQPGRIVLLNNRRGHMIWSRNLLAQWPPKANCNEHTATSPNGLLIPHTPEFILQHPRTSTGGGCWN